MVSAAASGEEEVASATAGVLATEGASEAASEVTEVGMAVADGAGSDTRATDSAAALHLKALHLVRVAGGEVGSVAAAAAAMAVALPSMDLAQTHPMAVGMEAAADTTTGAVETDSAVAAIGILSASASLAAATGTEIATVGTVAAETTTPGSEHTKGAMAGTRIRGANEGTRTPPPHLHLRHSNFRKDFIRVCCRGYFRFFSFSITIPFSSRVRKSMGTPVSFLIVIISVASRPHPLTSLPALRSG